MAINVQKSADTVSPLAGISFVNRLFDQVGMSNLIDNELGQRTRVTGYQYSEMGIYKI